VLCLDDFYRDIDDPGLPLMTRTPATVAKPTGTPAAALSGGGPLPAAAPPDGAVLPDPALVDWESPRSWDAAAAVDAIDALARVGRVEVPSYSIAASRKMGSHSIDLGGARLFIAEGIFAAEVVDACHGRGLLAGAFTVRRARAITFTRRLVRDLREHRKAPGVLIRRGIALFGAEPSVVAGQIAQGCVAASGAEILRRVARLT
jgi:uridine kinase